MRHLSAHNLLSDCQYGFRKGLSIDDPAFLTESSSFRDFDAVGLAISKAFNRVWQKSLIFNYALTGFILLSVPSIPVSFVTVLLLL